MVRVRGLKHDVILLLSALRASTNVKILETRLILATTHLIQVAPSNKGDSNKGDSKEGDTFSNKGDSNSKRIQIQTAPNSKGM